MEAYKNREGVVNPPEHKAPKNPPYLSPLVTIDTEDTLASVFEPLEIRQDKQLNKTTIDRQSYLS